MPRLIATVPQEMFDRLEQDAHQERIPMAEIVRRAIGEYYERRGIEVESRVEYGAPDKRQGDKG